MMITSTWRRRLRKDARSADELMFLEVASLVVEPSRPTTKVAIVLIA